MFKALLTTLTFISICNAATIWPKPQSQTSTTVEYTLDETTFSFNPAGPGSQSNILHDAFKRFRGIIFLHSPTNAATQKSNAILADATTITSVTVNVASADESLSLETDVGLICFFDPNTYCCSWHVLTFHSSFSVPIINWFLYFFYHPYSLFPTVSPFSSRSNLTI